MGHFRKNLHADHPIRHDWPYFVGTMCLITLLVSRHLGSTFLPPSLNDSFSRHSTYENNRSLQEIEANCYSEQSQPLILESCKGKCAEQNGTSATDGESHSFNRSMLICTEKDNYAGEGIRDESFQNLVIEVITADLAF